MRMVAGERCFAEEEVMDMEKAKGKLYDLLKMFTPFLPRAFGDLFPFLRWFTRRFGVEKKISEIHYMSDCFVQGLIDAHRNHNHNAETDADINRTIVDVMLKLQESEPEFYTDTVIKGIIQVVPQITLSIILILNHSIVVVY